jgi:hypothetical protein
VSFEDLEEGVLELFAEAQVEHRQEVVLDLVYRHRGSFLGRDCDPSRMTRLEAWAAIRWRSNARSLRRQSRYFKAREAGIAARRAANQRWGDFDAVRVAPDEASA